MSENNYARRTVSFTREDRDIIEYLDKLGKGKASEFIRQAVREKLEREKNKNKEEDLEAKIRRIVKEVLAERESSPQNIIKQSSEKVENTDDELNSAVINAIDSFDF